MTAKEMFKELGYDIYYDAYNVVTEFVKEEKWQNGFGCTIYKIKFWHKLKMWDAPQLQLEPAVAKAIVKELEELGWL